MNQIQAQQWLITSNGVAFQNIGKEGGSSLDGGYRSNNQNWKQVAKATYDFSFKLKITMKNYHF